MADSSLVTIGVSACAFAAFFWWKAMKTHREHQEWCAARTKADGTVSRIGTRGHLSRNEPTESASTFGDDSVTQNASAVAVVRFAASDGMEYEIDAPEVAREVGIRIPVAYDPVLPSDGRAVEHTPKIGCAVILFLAGIALIVAGILQ
jgi:hypothetical protein